MNKEITVDGKTYVLKERTYKIGDRFKVKEGWGDAGDVWMLIERGTDKVNFVKLENPSGSSLGVGKICSYEGFKVKDKHNITKEDLEERWRGGYKFFDFYELIED